LLGRSVGMHLQLAGGRWWCVRSCLLACLGGVFDDVIDVPPISLSAILLRLLASRSLFMVVISALSPLRVFCFGWLGFGFVGLFCYVDDCMSVRVRACVRESVTVYERVCVCAFCLDYHISYRI